MISSFDGQYRFLSNFYELEFYYIGNQVYRSAEHAYQSEKAFTWEDRKKIMDASSPGKAKALGYKIHVRPDWEFIKMERMLTIVRRKFDHPDIKAALLATGDELLEEGNIWEDTFWGVCRGNGLNILGKILMLVRDEKRQGWIRS